MSSLLNYEDYGITQHYFYVPLKYASVWIHAWCVKVPFSESDRYYCSIYENGQIVEPDKDVRFLTHCKELFANKPWVECHFTSDLAMFRFIKAASL